MAATTRSQRSLNSSLRPPTTGQAPRAGRSRSSSPLSRTSSHTRPTATPYHEACLWNTAPGNIRCAAAGRGGLWTGEADGTLAFRALPAGAVKAVVPRKPQTHCNALLVLGGVVWAGLSDGFIRVFDSASADLLAEFIEHDGAVLCLAEGGGSVFSGGEDWKVRQWNPRTFRQERMLDGHRKSVRCAAHTYPSLSTDAAAEWGNSAPAARLFTGSDDGAILVWDVSPGAVGGAPMHSFSAHGGQPVLSLVIVPAVAQVWTGGEDGSVGVWSIRRLRPVATVRRHTAPVTSVQRVGKRVWSGGKDGQLVVWDAKTHSPLRTLAAHGARAALHVVCAAVSCPTVRVVSSGPDGDLQCWAADVEESAPAEAASALQRRLLDVQAESNTHAAEAADLRAELERSARGTATPSRASAVPNNDALEAQEALEETRTLLVEAEARARDAQGRQRAAEAQLASLQHTALLASPDPARPPSPSPAMHHDDVVAMAAARAAEAAEQTMLEEERRAEMVGLQDGLRLEQSRCLALERLVAEQRAELERQAAVLAEARDPDAVEAELQLLRGEAHTANLRFEKQRARGLILEQRLKHRSGAGAAETDSVADAAAEHPTVSQVVALQGELDRSLERQVAAETRAREAESVREELLRRLAELEGSAAFAAEAERVHASTAERSSQQAQELAACREKLASSIKRNRALQDAAEAKASEVRRCGAETSRLREELRSAHSRGNAALARASAAEAESLRVREDGVGLRDDVARLEEELRLAHEKLRAYPARVTALVAKVEEFEAAQSEQLDAKEDELASLRSALEHSAQRQETPELPEGVVNSEQESVAAAAVLAARDLELAEKEEALLALEKEKAVLVGRLAALDHPSPAESTAPPQSTLEETARPSRVLELEAALASAEEKRDAAEADAATLRAGALAAADNLAAAVLPPPDRAVTPVPTAELADSGEDSARPTPAITPGPDTPRAAHARDLQECVQGVVERIKLLQADKERSDAALLEAQAALRAQVRESEALRCDNAAMDAVNVSLAAATKRVQELEVANAKLDGDLAALQATVAAAPSAPPTLRALQCEVDVLRSRLAALEPSAALPDDAVAKWRHEAERLRDEVRALHQAAAMGAAAEEGLDAAAAQWQRELDDEVRRRSLADAAAAAAVAPAAAPLLAENKRLAALLVDRERAVLAQSPSEGSAIALREAKAEVVAAREALAELQAEVARDAAACEEWARDHTHVPVDATSESRPLLLRRLRLVTEELAREKESKAEVDDGEAARLTRALWEEKQKVAAAEESAAAELDQLRKRADQLAADNEADRQQAAIAVREREAACRDLDRCRDELTLTQAELGRLQVAELPPAAPVSGNDAAAIAEVRATVAEEKADRAEAVAAAAREREQEVVRQRDAALIDVDRLHRELGAVRDEAAGVLRDGVEVRREAVELDGEVLALKRACLDLCRPGGPDGAASLPASEATGMLRDLEVALARVRQRIVAVGDGQRSLLRHQLAAVVPAAPEASEELPGPEFFPADLEAVHRAVAAAVTDLAADHAHAVHRAAAAETLVAALREANKRQATELTDATAVAEAVAAASQLSSEADFHAERREALVRHVLRCYGVTEKASVGLTRHSAHVLELRAHWPEMYNAMVLDLNPALEAVNQTRDVLYDAVVTCFTASEAELFNKQQAPLPRE